MIKILAHSGVSLATGKFNAFAEFRKIRLQDDGTDSATEMRFFVKSR
jgi:hypothetical protein